MKEQHYLIGFLSDTLQVFSCSVLGIDRVEIGSENYFETIKEITAQGGLITTLPTSMFKENPFEYYIYRGTPLHKSLMQAKSEETVFDEIVKNSGYFITQYIKERNKT